MKGERERNGGERQVGLSCQEKGLAESPCPAEVKYLLGEPP